MQNLSPPPSPDTEKKFWRSATTKASSQERNDATVLKKNDTVIATKTAMEMDMVNIIQETLFDKVEFPYVFPVEDLKHIHPYIKRLFSARKIPNVQLAGRLKNFIENWEVLTNDTEFLWLTEAYTIPFHEILLQKSIPNSPKLSQEEKILAQKEIYEMLNKGAIAETSNHLEGEFICNSFS